MKTKLLNFLLNVAIALILCFFFSSFVEDGEGGTSGAPCSVSLRCFDRAGTVVKRISCSGKDCLRGDDYVDCDKNRKNCK